jgi:formylglycine-generating enzyme required for sulfatase activity
MNADTDVVVHTSVPDLVTIPAGDFWMGDDGGRPDERPARQVWVDAVAAARTPVTNAQYAALLNATGRAPPRFWEDPRFNQPAQPVVGVSWHDAVAYCAWLTRITGRRHRLPTEAEWERAARGGRERQTYPWGDDPAGWAADPALARTRHEQPNPVGLTLANGFGLLDMGYNVHEWCSDWYDPGYYAVSPARNPEGPPAGTRRASRGGAWRHQIQVCRCAARSSLDPAFQYNDYGFRVFADVGT